MAVPPEWSESAVANYLITGTSSGIGRAMAKEAVRRGHRVWGVARRKELLAELARELGEDRFLFSACDVGDLEDVRSATREMGRRSFVPDVVILNAGINPEARGAPFTIGGFEEVTRINLFGALACVDAFLPAFRDRGRGQFVAISSLAAYRGDSRWVAYAASKAALSRAFESLRGRHSREGVRFTTIHLGAVGTGMGAKSHSPFRLSQEQASRQILDAAERGAQSMTVPRLLRVLLELMRILPDPLFSRIVGGAFDDSEEGESRGGGTANHDGPHRGDSP